MALAGAAIGSRTLYRPCVGSTATLASSTVGPPPSACRARALASANGVYTVVVPTTELATTVPVTSRMELVAVRIAVGVPSMRVLPVVMLITDNAALTYLGSLVDGLSHEFKTALVAGAVAGGGLTVIANAPNPAGVSILKEKFPDGAIHPLGLLVAALPPTLVAVLAFKLL